MITILFPLINTESKVKLKIYRWKESKKEHKKTWRIAPCPKIGEMLMFNIIISSIY